MENWIYKTGTAIPEEVRCHLETGGELPLLKYPSFERLEFVKHGFTTREGGVSEGIYESLNLGLSRGDERALVVRNFERVAEALESSIEKMVLSDQTHTTNIRRVTEADAGKGIVRPRDYADVDGLITNVPGLLLTTFYADCVPLFFADPVGKAVGLSHSGWRGTVNGMGKKTIEAMMSEFGSRPEEIICAIGPSICQDCYEVSEDVAEQFMERFNRYTDNVVKKSEKPGKYQLDLWKANEYILLEAGVREEHISVTELCTCCNKTRLFSHRASQGKRGNLAAFLGIRV